MASKSGFAAGKASELVILIQEHKLISQEEVDEAAAWLRPRGWKSMWDLATGSGRSRSGGTAVICHEDLGVIWPGDDHSSPWRSRACMVVIDCPGSWCVRGGFHADDFSCGAKTSH